MTLSNQNPSYFLWTNQTEEDYVKVKHIFGAQIKISAKPEKKNSCILA
jgi:hypothetical protein